ncbi:MAG: hypothetical protein PUB53_04810 [Bacteroidales bacterium]|nr:hypothetical protein [Bacteroidales bacterium]
MTDKSWLWRNNPPSRHAWPSLRFATVFPEPNPCEETPVLPCLLQAFKALGEQASCLLKRQEQAGCLLSQCTVASCLPRERKHSGKVKWSTASENSKPIAGINAKNGQPKSGKVSQPKSGKVRLKGLKGLKSKPFSQFPSENQQE